MSHNADRKSKYRSIKKMNSTMGNFDKQIKRSSFHGGSKPKTMEKGRKADRHRDHAKALFVNRKLKGIDQAVRECAKRKYNLNTRYAFNTHSKQLDLSKLIQTGNKFHLDQSLKMVD